MSIQSLLVGLANADVSFVIVGGVAGAIHGSPFVTNDLDICYEPGRANVGKLARLLKKWNAYPKEGKPALPFVIDARTLATTPITTLRTTEGDLDLLDRVDGVGGFPDAFESSEELTAFSIRFRVLTLDALIRARRASARPKDLAQIQTLEALADLKAG